MTRPTIPAEWLPHATVPVTCIWDHPSYDTWWHVIHVARDWKQRGEHYVRQIAGVDGEAALIAAFEGEQRSVMGYAIRD